MSRRHSVFPVVALCLILSLSGCAFRTASLKSNVTFNPESAYQHIATLSSAEFDGRLPGTRGNELAALYISNFFAQLGLVPGGDANSYYQYYRQHSLNYHGSPVILEIVDRAGRLVESFSYREDFMELFLNGPHYDVTTAFSLNGGEVGTEVIAYSMGTPPLTHPHIQLIERAIMGGGPHPGPTRVYLKSPHISGQGRGMFITPETYAKLSEHQQAGHLIRVAASISFPQVDAMNVIGILPAKQPTSDTLIISAHFDHLGSDPDGTVNFGAADNASGVGTMLELAHGLTTYGNPYPFNVAFIAFNGEEAGLLGSRYYTQKLPTKSHVVGVLNLDMVGISDANTLAIVRGTTGDKLSKDIRRTASRLKITTEIWDASAGSDHYPFSEVGIDAVTLLHYSQHHFDHFYHVPADTIETISVAKLEEVGRLTLQFLEEFAAKYRPKRSFFILELAA